MKKLFPYHDEKLELDIFPNWKYAKIISYDGLTTVCIGTDAVNLDLRRAKNMGVPVEIIDCSYDPTKSDENFYNR